MHSKTMFAPALAVAPLLLLVVVGASAQAAARSGRQHQHSRDGESWTEPRGGACHRRVPEHSLRWLHAQEIAGKLQFAAIPFSKMLRAAAQGHPYVLVSASLAVGAIPGLRSSGRSKRLPMKKKEEARQ